MENINSIAKRWNELKTDVERWEYLLSHKNEIGLMLDNDGTYAVFHSSIILDGIEDLQGLKSFDHWLGRSPGVVDLLSILGIQGEPV